MKLLLRSPISLLAVLAGAAALPSAVVAAPVPAGEASRAVATLDACHADPVQALRYATFGAHMSQIRGGRSMSVRFDLFQRDSGVHFRRVAVAAPGFGVWHPSAPGVGLLRYSQEVANLPAPESYRVEVSFRWLNARNRVIRRARRVTAACVFSTERPNLVAGRITLRRGPSAATTTYDVAVRNVGLVRAGPFAVALTVAGAPLPAQTLTGLAPFGRQVVSFNGPNCLAGGTVTATVDAAGVVDESTKADNVRSIAC